jgi:hypothetical protein
MRKFFQRRLSRVEVGTVAASAMAVVFGLAHADTPHMLGSLFGLAPTQAVRISVSSNDGPAITGNTIKGESNCFVQVKIFDGAGMVKVQTDFLKILPGAVFSADLKYEDFKGNDNPKLAATDFTNRVQLRVASYISSDPAGIKLEQHKIGGCLQDIKMVKLGLEVFDTSSGKTTFMVPTESLLPAVQ